MNTASIRVFLLAVIFICALSVTSLSQQTSRESLALELPELNTGRMTAPRSFIARTDVNVIKFWILNPAADTIDWIKVKVRINRQSANVACSQNAAAQGKVVKCDLNRFAGFRLQPKENLFEIEAVSRDGKSYFGSFVVLTDANAAAKQNSEATKNGQISAPTKSGELGFSGRKFAVVIGVSQYQYNDIGLNNLNFADDDADAVYNWLTRSGGFNPQDVLYLTNKDATLSTVRDSLNRFLTKATENDLILFFLAGHGTPDPFNPTALYYLVYDSKIADLKNTGFSMSELKQIIDTKLKSKRAIFLLDTCHSAGVSGKKIVVAKRREKTKSGERNISEDEFDERELERVEIKNEFSAVQQQLFASSGRAVITSSDINETSRESERWGGGHGVFTWALLEGLRGDADANADKIVTANEIFDFVRLKVRAETKQKQNPRLFLNLKADLQIAAIK